MAAIGSEKTAGMAKELKGDRNYSRRKKAEVRGNNSNGLDDLEYPNRLGDFYIPY
jgi:hypothetical protein